MVVSFIDGNFVKKIMEKDQISVTEPGIPHISIALEDSISYEWWDGPYESTPCPGVFDEYKKNRVGPADYSD
jgi:hypothetical protein